MRILAPGPVPHTSTLQELYGKYSINITFQVTEDCCMACTYCYQNHKTNRKMTWDIAKDTIDQILNIDNVNDYQTLVIDFIGGEPLMEIELIDKICSYTIDTMIEQQHPWLPWVRFSICSNGLLYFTPSVQNFFQKFSSFVHLTFSIDGNKELHDSCRVDKNNNATYDKIIDAVFHYRNNFGPLLDTKMTLSPENISYLSDAIINLINIDYTRISVNCIFEKGWDYSHATILYNELKIIGDYLVENKLYNKIYVRFFSESLYQPMTEDDDKNWCGGIIVKDSFINFAIDYKGDIYPCIRYMESSLNHRQEPLNLGNIYTGYGQTDEEKKHIKLLSNITRHTQSADECINCPIAAGCSWCSGYNYEEFGTPDKRATYICCMHQAASLANVYFMNKVYQDLNLNQHFTMYIPKDWALNIIDENEYNYLLKISQE